jgi:hypothetical protein
METTISIQGVKVSSKVRAGRLWDGEPEYNHSEGVAVRSTVRAGRLPDGEPEYNHSEAVFVTCPTAKARAVA